MWFFIYDWRYFRRSFGVDIWPEKDFKVWWDRNINYKNEIIRAQMEPILYRKDKTKCHGPENTIWMPLSLIKTMEAADKAMEELIKAQTKLNKYSQFTTFLDTKKGSL